MMALRCSMTDETPIAAIIEIYEDSLEGIRFIVELEHLLLIEFANFTPTNECVYYLVQGTD